MFLPFQVVNVLYTENDWVYVVSEDTKEGFIPNSYCAAYGTQQATLILNMKKKMPRDNSSLLLGGGVGLGGGGDGGRGKLLDHHDSDLTQSTSAPNITAGKSKQRTLFNPIQVKPSDLLVSLKQ